METLVWKYSYMVTGPSNLAQSTDHCTAMHISVLVEHTFQHKQMNGQYIEPSLYFLYRVIFYTTPHTPNFSTKEKFAKPITAAVTVNPVNKKCMYVFSPSLL